MSNQFNKYSDDVIKNLCKKMSIFFPNSTVEIKEKINQLDGSISYKLTGDFEFPNDKLKIVFIDLVLTPNNPDVITFQGKSFNHKENIEHLFSMIKEHKKLYPESLS